MKIFAYERKNLGKGSVKRMDWDRQCRKLNCILETSNLTNENWGRVDPQFKPQTNKGNSSELLILAH